MSTRVKHSKEFDELINKELDTKRPKKSKDVKGKDSKGDKSSKSKAKDNDNSNPWFHYEASSKLRDLLLQSARFSKIDKETISKITFSLRVHRA